MDKLSKIKGKLLVAPFLILAITLLSACSIEGSTLGAFGIRITATTLGAIGNRTTGQLLTICHATDDPANPYEELNLNTAELNVHRGHPNDIIPMPANGCPASPVITSDGKIAICHATGSQTNPYNEITVSVDGLNGHNEHEGDIIPAPEGGCPTTSSAISNRTTTTFSTIGNRITTIFGKIGNRTTTTPLLTACHATGDPANPYEEITITNDISPVPANGCPENPVLISDGKITICHATGSQTNPYNEIIVSVVGLNGHGTHEGDVFPSPDEGCPSSSGVIDNSTTTTFSTIGNRITTTLGAFGNRITTIFGKIGNRTTTIPLSNVCHATDDPANPYEELNLNTAELNVHRGHPNDIIPVPANGCPASPVITSDGKIAICHATGSQTNPYDEIIVSVDGLNDHGTHEGDIIPAPEGGCSTIPWTTSNDKITICHATGSQKNPYNEITVSVNGLNGHNGHGDDIIPAPGGGCPTSPQGKKSNNGKP